MSEGWTTSEARKAEKWCDGKGYENGVPKCDGRATKKIGDGRYCQKCHADVSAAFEDLLRRADALGEPKANTKPGRRCWFVDETFFVERLGYRLSIVDENEDGHRPNGTWPYHGKIGETLPYAAPTIEAAKEMADRLNERMGVSKKTAHEIVLRSMFQCVTEEARQLLRDLVACMDGGE